MSEAGEGAASRSSPDPSPGSRFAYAPRAPPSPARGEGKRVCRSPLSHRFNFQTATLIRFRAPMRRRALRGPPQKTRGSGAPGNARPLRSGLRAAGAAARHAGEACRLRLRSRRRASRRSTCGFSVPGAVLPGGMTGAPFGSPHPGGSRRPSVFRQRPAQFRAAGPSAGGRTARGLPVSRLQAAIAGAASGSIFGLSPEDAPR